MLAYIIRRIVICVPLLLLVVTVVFFAFQLVPGDAADMYCGDEATPDEIARVRERLGLDKPVIVQYAKYLSSLLRGDFGKSIYFRGPVLKQIIRSFPNTVKLAVGAILLATTLGLVLGTISAVKHGRVIDHLSGIFAIIGISIPNFWLGLLLMYMFSLKLGLLPVAGSGTWKHYIMPVITLSVFSMAFITRMTRSSLLETIEADYVRTARAKGLSENLTIIRHALRNALIPTLSVVGLRFGYMLGGSVVIEQVFVWPGMGRLFVLAVGQRDVAVVQGVLLIFAISFLLINLLVDVAYTLIDPRIRYS